MPYALATLSLTTLLVAYGGLLAYEARRGRRILDARRARLDAIIARVEFVVTRVDWRAFSADVARTAILRLVHDVVHGTLVAVRTIERVLTRIVKALRERRTVAPLSARRSFAERTRDAFTYVRNAVRAAKREVDDE